MHFRTGQWDEACWLVEAYHYSRRIPGNVQLVGSVHDDGGLFGDAGPILAAAFFSFPPTRWSEPVIELTRLVRAERQVPLTSLVSRCVDILAKRGERLVVSFADRTHGHFGGVYQACSWAYSGCRERRVDGCIVDGQFVPGRSCNARWGTRSPTRLSNKLGRPVTPHYDEGKHLYWKATGVAGRSKAKRLGLSSLPYPKNADSPQDELTARQSEAGATPAVRSNDLVV